MQAGADLRQANLIGADLTGASQFCKGEAFRQTIY
ncbi:pentapeptide repeat-containing protein [Microcoleus sp. herbarium19]